MLDINKIENNFKEVCDLLNIRQQDYTNKLKEILDLNSKRKTIIQEVENLKSIKNSSSKKIGILLQKKELNEVNALKKDVEKMSLKINELDKELNIIGDNMNNKLLFIPNTLNKSVPVGVDENDNVWIRQWETKTKPKNNSLPHWEIAKKLKLVDFEYGVKLSGSRFLSYVGNGSKMVRAIVDILLTRHIKHGYYEILPPLLVNKENMIGAGQLPKFENDAYSIDSQYLIPTSEVALVNSVRDEVVIQNKLPIYLTAATPCFRKESGSAGIDTKGMIRMHQFNKVELVKICLPSTSEEELEKMVLDAENCLQMFEIPYRVIELCSGDVGFHSQKTYDLEVWLPNQNKYREISSCSNCGDFQARRMNAKYKDENGKLNFLHTLNGTGVAVDRLIAALLENHYDGEVLYLPEVLRPYFNNEKYLK